MQTHTLKGGHQTGHFAYLACFAVKPFALSAFFAVKNVLCFAPFWEQATKRNTRRRVDIVHSNPNNVYFRLQPFLVT